MHAPSPHLSAAPLAALLKDGVLVGEWVLDPDNSSIRLKSSSLGGLVRVNGVFRQITGNGTVSPDGAVSGTVTVSAGSIDTNNNRRDSHLRSADFFDSANRPDLTFAADGVWVSDQGIEVTGALTVRDCSRALSFAAAVAVGDDGQICLDAEVPINRADFGLTWNRLGMVSMHNTLAIHAVFTRR